MKKQVWFITGASKGLGLALVKRLLEEGHFVAATSRNTNALETAVGNSYSNFLPLSMQLGEEASVKKAITATVDRFGRIDVLVNNAGYGLTGALEELSDAETRQNFDINVFGTLNVIRQVMPQLRLQKNGHILNIASIGGFSGGFPGFGIYCATKFAVQGLTESLAHEIAEFGLFATVVMPGYFRTNFLSEGSLFTPQQEIAAYTKVREIQNTHTGEYDGNQAGDPIKAAEVMMKVAGMDNPPIHLFLGQDAYNVAAVKIDAVKKDMDLLKAAATATALN